MDIRNVSSTEPHTIHGQGPVWRLVPPESLRTDTAGSFLDRISEFEIEPGAAVSRHAHDGHEFYYLLQGAGTMHVGSESQAVQSGDLVHIPPFEPHSLAASPDGPLRALTMIVTSQAVSATWTTVTDLAS